MNERILYPDIIRGLKFEGHHPYRIHDGGGCENPFDIGGCMSDGRGLALEVKVDRRASDNLGGTIYWPDFATHQRRWLLTFAEAGAIALAVIYWLPGHRMHAYRLTAYDIEQECISPLRATILKHENHMRLGWQSLIATVCNQ